MKRRISVCRILALCATLAIVPLGCDPSGKDLHIGKLETENKELKNIIIDTGNEKHMWQMLTIVGCSIAVILLFVGAGLGSSARRRARQHNEQ